MKPQSIHISCQTSLTKSFDIQNESLLDRKHIFYGTLSQMGKLTCGTPKSPQNYVLFQQQPDGSPIAKIKMSMVGIKL